MAAYALVDPAGVIVQITPTIFTAHSSLRWTTDLSGVTPAPQVGWIATLAGNAWTFAAPTAPAASVVPAAQAMLDLTDRVALRCVKAGVAYPAAWNAVAVTCRGIVNGSTPTAALPTTLPAFPAGT